MENGYWNTVTKVAKETVQKTRNCERDLAAETVEVSASDENYSADKDDYWLKSFYCKMLHPIY